MWRAMDESSRKGMMKGKTGTWHLKIPKKKMGLKENNKKPAPPMPGTHMRLAEPERWLL